MPKTPQKRLYCYVDETGQDAGSDYFIVVSIVTEAELQNLKTELTALEAETKIGLKKWHKSRSPEREDFLKMAVRRSLAAGEVYYAKFKRPLPFFLPLLETVERAIKDKAGNETYRATVYVDGIDKKKAKELTGGLRLKGISLKYVRSARDESEPFIRLADRWAGCIRHALEGELVSKQILTKAELDGYLKPLEIRGCLKRRSLFLAQNRWLGFKIYE